MSVVMLRTIWQHFTVEDTGISLCETEIRFLALDLRKEIQTEDQMESYTGPVQTTTGLGTVKNARAILSSLGW